MRVVGRALLAATVLAGASLAIHGIAAAILAGLLAARSPSGASPQDPVGPGPTPSTARSFREPDPPEDESPAPEALVRDVQARRLLLGEALITQSRLGKARTEEAKETYRGLLRELGQGLPGKRSDVPAAVTRFLRERGLDAYKALYHDLGSGLLHHGGDCRARAELVVALLYDSGHRYQTGARVYANHVAPVFHDGHREHRFGLVARCKGLGTLIGPLGMLEADLPASVDRCQDERPLVGAGLRDDDPEPSWSGQEEPMEASCPLADWPWLETGDEVYLLRPRARWEPLYRIDTSRPKLEDHAAGLECHTRSLAAIKSSPKSTDRVLAALGRAVAYGEQTALVLAAAGEHDSARWVEERTRGWYREAEAMLGDFDLRGVPLRAELASLIHLGPRGHTVLLGIVPRHICWVGSDLLAILVHEPATRDRALALYLTRIRPQQIESADRMYWTDEGFQEAIGRHPAGRRALLLRAAVTTARTRWQSCNFEELLRAVQATVGDFVLEPEWFGPLVAVLAEDARVHLADHRCEIAPFMQRVRSWAKEQGGEIRLWIDRQSSER